MSELLDVHAYVDGELSESDAETLRARIATDPRWIAEERAIRRLKALLAGRAGEITPADKITPEDVVWCHCLKRVRELDRVQRIESFVGRFAWGLSGLVFLALAGAGMFFRQNSDAVLYPADVAQLAAVGGVSLRSPNQGLTGHLRNIFGHSPVHSPPAGLEVLDMIQSVHLGQPVVQVNMVDAHGAITLLIVGGATDVRGFTPSGEAFLQARLDCVNCIGWPSHGNFVVLVSDRPHEDLMAFARRLRAD